MLVPINCPVTKPKKSQELFTLRVCVQVFIMKMEVRFYLKSQERGNSVQRYNLSHTKEELVIECLFNFRLYYTYLVLTTLNKYIIGFICPIKEKLHPLHLYKEAINLVDYLNKLVEDV